MTEPGTEQLTQAMCAGWTTLKPVLADMLVAVLLPPAPVGVVSCVGEDEAPDEERLNASASLPEDEK